MSPLGLSLIAFACILAGTFFGMVIRALLPEHHLSDDSKDVVKLGIGMVATLAALVLGLLLASAKANYDTLSSELKQVSGRIVLLDRVLAQYGPETAETRDLLRKGVAATVEKVWPEKSNKVPSASFPKPANYLEMVQDKLRYLSPRDDAHRQLQSRAIQVAGDIADTRWLLFTQLRQSSIQTPFLILLVFWLVIIFGSFGLFSPRNATVIIVLLVCIISATGSLYMILELDQPYQGLVKISSAPLQTALMFMGQ